MHLSIYNKYSTYTTAHYQPLDNTMTTTIDNIVDLNSRLNYSIYNALDNTVDRKTTAEINGLKWFWILELEKAKAYREIFLKNGDVRNTLLQS